MDGGFRNDVGVETVAKIDGVDVIARGEDSLACCPRAEAHSDCIAI